MALVKNKVPVPADQKFVPKISTTAALPMDIPWDRLHATIENPNEQDESTFDRMVESIKADGFDEFPIVVPRPDMEGHYWIVSGHHRVKGFHVVYPNTDVPCIIKEGWDEDKHKIELVARNMIRGNLNPEKFSALYNDLAKRYDRALLQKMMGFTKKDAFSKLYKSMAASLPAKEKKKLEEAKETIKDVDDLSSILNTIFKESGSEVDKGYMVFSFGGKEHHYFKIDAPLNAKLKALEKSIASSGKDASMVFNELLSGYDPGVKTGGQTSAKIIVKPKPKGLK